MWWCWAVSSCSIWRTIRRKRFESQEHNWRLPHNFLHKVQDKRTACICGQHFADLICQSKLWMDKSKKYQRPGRRIYHRWSTLGIMGARKPKGLLKRLGYQVWSFSIWPVFDWIKEILHQLSIVYLGNSWQIFYQWPEFNFKLTSIQINVYETFSQT